MKKRSMIIGLLIAVLSLGMLPNAQAQNRYRRPLHRQKMERIVVRTPHTRIVITEPRYARRNKRFNNRPYAYNYRRWDVPRYRRHARWEKRRYCYDRKFNNYPDNYYRDNR